MPSAFRLVAERLLRVSKIGVAGVGGVTLGVRGEEIMGSRVLIAVVLLGSFWAPTTHAQKFEISPFAGLRFGGAVTAGLVIGF